MDRLREKSGFICDMDGVIYHGNKILPGVREFVDWLQRENKHFLFLTNSSHYTPKELQQKLARMGLEVTLLYECTGDGELPQPSGAGMQRLCRR